MLVPFVWLGKSLRKPVNIWLIYGPQEVTRGNVQSMSQATTNAAVSRAANVSQMRAADVASLSAPDEVDSDRGSSAARAATDNAHVD